MFDSLSNKLESAFKILKGHGKITEINVAETLKEVRRALLDADVNFKIAKEFTNTVKEKAIGAKVLTSLEPGQLMIKIVKDELTELMGSAAEEINLSTKPAVILMSGLQGSGKTTFSGKLAHYFRNKKQKNPILVACDVHRPAAINQLNVIGEQIGVDVYSDLEEKNPVKIAKKAISEAKQKNKDLVIIDTAGRLQTDEEMINEIKLIHEISKPDETIYIADSMMGQDIVVSAEIFNKSIEITGSIIGDSAETVTLDAGAGTTTVGAIGSASQIGTVKIGSSDNGNIVIKGSVDIDGSFTAIF